MLPESQVARPVAWAAGSRPTVAAAAAGGQGDGEAGAVHHVGAGRVEGAAQGHAEAAVAGVVEGGAVGQDVHVGVFLVGAGLADVFEAGVGQHGEDGLDLFDAGFGLALGDDFNPRLDGPAQGVEVGLGGHFGVAGR